MLMESSRHLAEGKRVAQDLQRSLLKRGNIILTAENTLISKGVRVGTASRYSHAITSPRPTRDDGRARLRPHQNERCIRQPLTLWRRSLQ